MNLITFLRTGCSKLEAQTIAQWIGNSLARFEQLLNLFLTDKEYKVVQRAAWPLSDAAIKHPELIEKYYPQLTAHWIMPGLPVAVRRNILRIFDQVPSLPGSIMDACYQYISDTQEAIASQAYTLGILHRISKIYPDILSELITIVEIMLRNAPPAYMARVEKY